MPVGTWNCFSEKSLVRVYDDDKEFYRVLPIDEVSKGDYIQSFQLLEGIFKFTIEEVMDVSIGDANALIPSKALQEIVVLKNGEEKRLVLTKHHYVYLKRDGEIIKTTVEDARNDDLFILFDYENETLVPSFIKMFETKNINETEKINNVCNIFTRSFNLIVDDFAATCLTTANEAEIKNCFN